MKKLFVFLCFVSAIVFARDLSVSIDAIDIDSQHSGTTVVLTLSNGTTWKKFITPENESDLLKIEKRLQVGDEVSIFTEKCQPNIYISKKGKTGSGIDFGPSSKTISSLPTITNLKRIEIEPAGWFSSAKHGYELELSDGSVWRYPWNIYPMWFKGHTILVGTEMNKGQYSLINLDAKHAEPILYGATADFRQLYWSLLEVVKE